MIINTNFKYALIMLKKKIKKNTDCSSPVSDQIPKTIPSIFPY